jgi:hypothetical protein
MAKQSTKAQEEKIVKVKSRVPLRDIRPKENKNSFLVQQLNRDDMPEVEPLIEDQTEDNTFHIEKIEKDVNEQSASMPKINVTSLAEDGDDDYESSIIKNIVEAPPKETVRVKFSKFVQLVANRDFGAVAEANANEEITMSSNLLTELAGANDQRNEKKIPLVFLVGIAIGVVLTYILFST